MEVKINGEVKNFEDRLTILAMLDALGIKSASVVVERNLSIVPRSAMAEEIVQAGDKIEIIRLVGGG